jgi:catechol 2,3-dioxygenase-like lactoylglutathione lyase family enzyme
LGTGRGLDHVIIVVRDLEKAAGVYSEDLGFAVIRGGSFPGGVRNSAVVFGANYLELLTVDASQPGADEELVRVLKEREGGYAFALNVSSAQQTGAFLRARNFEVSAPQGSSFVPEATGKVQKNLWQTVSITKPVLSFEPMFFIEYAPRQTTRQLPEHRNTAVGIRSVWIAVKDLEAAKKGYEELGLQAGREQEMAQLGARSREIAAGQGVILVLQADDAKGAVASYVAQHGEGVVGVSIEVRDLKVARSLLQSSTKQELNPYKGVFGESILVAPAFTHGVWIELIQKRGI